VPGMAGSGPADRSPGQEPDQGTRAGGKRARRTVADRWLISRPPGGPTGRCDRPRPRANLQLPADESRSRGVVGSSPALRSHRAGRIIRYGDNGALPVHPLAGADGRAGQRCRCRPAGQDLRGQARFAAAGRCCVSWHESVPLAAIPFLAPSHPWPGRAQAGPLRPSCHPLSQPAQKDISHQTSAMRYLRRHGSGRPGATRRATRRSRPN
jgi:hypothetical protein